METRGKHPKILMMLLILTMFLMVFPTSIFAEETPSVEVPVTVRVDGTAPEDSEIYTVVFEADNPDYPMPAASEDGVYNLTITGEDTVAFPEIKFSQRGIYTYTIYQSPGTNELASYDETMYNLVVYVTNAQDVTGLETTVLLYLVGEVEKLDEILFVNEYEEVIPPIPRTSDDTVIWPYVGLFILGLSLLVLLRVTARKGEVEE